MLLKKSKKATQKASKKIFQKPLARKKRLCIFALGFGDTFKTDQIQIFNKDSKDTKQ